MEQEPKTLQGAIQYFSDPDNCREYVMARRWPDGVVCPTCGGTDVRFLSTRKIWECKGKHPRRQFSVKVGTIFEDSPLGLDKWLCAMWLLVSCKNGISSYEVSRDLGISQKSAWHVMHRVRLALHQGSFNKLTGEVEIDETFIGGKFRNMHKSRKRRMQASGNRADGKTIVMGMLERMGKVRATVIQDRTKATMQPIVREHIEPGTQVFADEWAGYWRMDEEYVTNVINHTEAYVKGNVHTNTLENFWSCLKRTLGGTYVSVEPFHLFRYLDEQAYRYNNRKDMNDSDRFDLAVRQIVGKRLTWAEVTGKVSEIQPSVN
jgi:transposase-like protein